MPTRYCQQQIQWIGMNSLFLRVAAALIMAVGIAGLIGGTVLCRGNTIEIINGDSVQGIYPEMGIPVIVFRNMNPLLRYFTGDPNRRYEDSVFLPFFAKQYLSSSHFLFDLAVK
ncbi:hypothetical protein TcWFU_003530 [Taenia crassiceps]|uniref:Uncharacterized protein n=1 Tax=Taenia crassiceps TaxID=6207 RepID=A0ABR4Q7Y2_9CEST